MEDKNIKLYKAGINETPIMVIHSFGLFRRAFNSANIFLLFRHRVYFYDIINYKLINL